MNQLYKQSNHDFEPNNQPSKLSSLVQFNDPNRQKPNLLRINADNQDKKFMCIFWSIFLAFIITLVIVSKTCKNLSNKQVPPAIKPITNSGELQGTSLNGCQNPSVFQNDQLQCGSFASNNLTVGILAKQLSSLNQFVAFWLYIYPKDLNYPFVIDQNVTYIVYGLQSQNNGFKRTNIFQNQTVAFQYSSQSTNYIYQEGSTTIKGYKVFLGFIGQFPADDFWLGLRFSGPFEQFSNVNSIQIQAYKISKTFTRFMIGMRYVFFVFSILAAFLFIRKYRKIPIQDRIVQQKLIAILSVFLIFFNDPFYPITVLKQNMARYVISYPSSFFSTLFVVAFIVYLIFMWVIFFDRIFYQEGQKETHQINKFKIAYAGVLFVLLMVLYMMYASYRLNNHPMVPTEKLSDRNILVLDALATVCFVGAMLYIFYQFIRICIYKGEGSRLWRSELFMSHSLLFMGAMIVFVFTDNALGSYHYDGTTVLFLYGLMNLYTWCLQYMYSPTKEAELQGSEKRSLHSDQIMSMGTVQFNDLNINMDDHEVYHKFDNQKEARKVNQAANPSHSGWAKNVNRRDESSEEGQKNENNWSIEDEDQVPSNKKQAYKQVQNGFNGANQLQPHAVEEDQKVNFFNRQNINNFTDSSNPNKSSPKNQTNLLQMSDNPIAKSTQPSHENRDELLLDPDRMSEVDQNKFEVFSEVRSELPEQEEGQKEDYNHLQSEINQQSPEQDRKKNQGFGDFQLE